MTLYPNVDSWNQFACQSELENNEVYKAVLFCQFMHETGLGTSELFKVHKNLYGMRPARKREQFWSDIITYNTQNGQSSYAVYESNVYSLLDRLDWDRYNNIPAPFDSKAIARYMLDVYQNNYFTDSPSNYLGNWCALGRQFYPELNFPTAEVLNEVLADSNVPNKSTLGNIAGVGVGTIILAALGYFLYNKYRKQ